MSGWCPKLLPGGKNALELIVGMRPPPGHILKANYTLEEEELHGVCELQLEEDVVQNRNKVKPLLISLRQSSFRSGILIYF